MPAADFTPLHLALIALAFFLGGAVKGTVGVGLKVVVLGLLAAIIDLRAAIALIIVPALVTNVWQVFSIGGLAATLRRIWPLLAALCVGAWFGTGILAGSDTHLLTGLLGILLCVYTLYALFTPRLHAPGRHERWMTPAIGGINGLLTGMTGVDVIPGVPYFASLGLSRDQMVQAMGLLFLVASLAVGAAFGGHGLLTADLAIGSALATVPTVAGFIAGAAVRRFLSEDRFRQILMGALFLLGLYILARASF